jgi:hypothetical protein
LGSGQLASIDAPLANHLLRRDNARQRIFASERDRLEFVRLMEASAKRFEVDGRQNAVASTS